MQQGFPGDGAGGGGRTRTVSPPLDFESSTSANSITPAYILFRTVSKSSLRKSEGDLEGDFEKTRFIRLSKALIYKGFRVLPGETATRILSSWTDSEMAGLERLSRAVDGHAENRCATRLYEKNRKKCLQRLPLRMMAEKTRFSANRRAFGGRSKGDYIKNRLF